MRSCRERAWRPECAQPSRPPRSTMHVAWVRAAPLGWPAISIGVVVSRGRLDAISIGHAMVGIAEHGKVEGAVAIKPLAGLSGGIAADGDHLGAERTKLVAIGVQFEEVMHAGVATVAQVEHQHDRPGCRVLRQPPSMALLIE